MNNTDFSEWLDAELQKRGWSPAELARRADTYPATIARIMNRERKPGPEVCQGIARAFKMPPEDVFRRAGLLPELPEGDSRLRRISLMLRELWDDERGQAVLPQIDVIVEALYRQVFGDKSVRTPEKKDNS